MVSAHQDSDGLLEEFFPDLCLAIWTTTPWTIPANAGKISKIKIKYLFLDHIYLSK